MTAPSDKDKKTRVWPYAAGTIIIGVLGGFIFSSGAYIGFAFQNWDDGLVYIGLGTSGLIAASAYGFAFGQAKENRENRAAIQRLEKSLETLTPAAFGDAVAERVPGIDKDALASAIVAQIPRTDEASAVPKTTETLPKLKPWVRRLFFEAVTPDEPPHTTGTPTPQPSDAAPTEPGTGRTGA